MDTPVSRVAAALAEPSRARWFRAPGRVNLMGDHTDYNGGFVLPLAIELECVIAAEPSADGRVRVRSLDDDALVDVAADGSESGRGWGRYVVGVLRALGERGRRAVGVNATLASSVPAGSGLSSSAALEVALALALADAGELVLAPHELALACQRAEELSTGVRGGVMDQLTSIVGREGHAVVIDCRSLDLDHVAVGGVDIVAVHSGIPRTLEGSAYAERRAACEAIAAELGLESLRDATLDQVRDRPLARHVVTENERVHATAAALREERVDDAGRLFAASHASLRDDYEVSTPELDALVEELAAAGAAGARLTGAGFGGCVVALADAATAERGAAAYARRTGREPRVYPCRAVAGAGRLER